MPSDFIGPALGIALAALLMPLVQAFGNRPLGPALVAIARRHFFAVLLLVGALVGVVALIVHEVAPLDGPSHCQAAVTDSLSKFHVADRAFTRTIDGHWAAAILLQSSDITAEPVTVLCHFQGASYAGVTLQVLKGDWLGRFKAASATNFLR